MARYEQIAFAKQRKWQEDMQKSPGFFNEVARKLQARINKAIPQKVHDVVTAAIKQMTRAVIFGAGYTTKSPSQYANLEALEHAVLEKIKVYRRTAAAEGGVTGAGGILLGFADFPIWLSIKMKMLFDIATQYGYDTNDFRERLYLLHIFQLTFSTQQKRKELFQVMKNWKEESGKFQDINSFDWQTFQIEYRDYIDLAKLLQLIPGVGAPVGIIVNHRLTNKLGLMAMNAYRLRLIQDRRLLLV